jgi:conjugal transfer pilus assembly protein TrbC
LLHVVRLIFSLLLCGLAAPIQATVALPTEKHAQEQRLIFVSLSMPQATLKALFDEAEAQGAVLVLRGLIDNSFKKTAEKLQEFGIALQIDPLLFKKHEIQRVPTFVWVTETQSHRLVGNVSLAYALAQFKAAS